MRVFLFGVSLLLIIFAFGLKIILIMSYSNYDDLMSNRTNLLCSSNLIERSMARVLYSLVDFRLIIGVIGIAGLIFSLVIN